MTMRDALRRLPHAHATARALLRDPDAGETAHLLAMMTVCQACAAGDPVGPDGYHGGTFACAAVSALTFGPDE